jgi:hypothetical protein
MLGFHVLNSRKKPVVRLNGVDMPPFHGRWFRVGEDTDKKKKTNMGGKEMIPAHGGYSYTPALSLCWVSKSKLYRLRMEKIMKKAETKSKFGFLRMTTRKFKKFYGWGQVSGGCPLHLFAKLPVGNLSFSNLIDPAFSREHIPSSAVVSSVPQGEASPGRMIFVFKKLSKSEEDEEKKQTKEEKEAALRKKFWAWTGSKSVLGGRTLEEQKEAYLADSRTDHSRKDGRFYFVWGKKENAKRTGEISVALRPGAGISVEVHPPIEANNILSVPTSRFGREQRQTRFFNPRAQVSDETHLSKVKVESIGARLNGGLFRVTALMTEEQLRECGAGELIDKFDRVLTVGSYRKLKLRMPK